MLKNVLKSVEMDRDEKRQLCERSPLLPSPTYSISCCQTLHVCEVKHYRTLLRTLVRAHVKVRRSSVSAILILTDLSAFMLIIIIIYNNQSRELAHQPSTIPSPTSTPSLPECFPCSPCALTVIDDLMIKSAMMEDD